ncbi:MAG: hypothetical protein ABSF29_09415 [Tepidisphaeraceae bacterium]|jgi:lipopolysaccharide biosynthesis glycosyltransferase
MPGAMITLIVGDPFIAAWKTHCQPNWQAYADKHNLELIPLTLPFDSSPQAMARHMTWQKLLIAREPRLKEHNNVLWIDADVIINSEVAPDIFEHIPPGKVGAVRSDVFFENPLLRDAFQRVAGNFASIEEYRASPFRHYGMSVVHPYINAGVLAFRDFDLALLERIYQKYAAATFKFGDQIPLSHELASAGLIHEIDPRFNAEWYCQKYSVYDFSNRFLPEMKRLYIAQALSACYFLHFCGNLPDMNYHDPQITLTPNQATIPLESVEAIARQIIEKLPPQRRQALLLDNPPQ